MAARCTGPDGENRLQVQMCRIDRRVACRFDLSSSLGIAMRTGTPFYPQLIRGLKTTAMGPERTQLLKLRRRDAQKALDEILGFSAFAEGSLSSTSRTSPEQLHRLSTTLAQVQGLCHRFDHAVEILEANSRACGESSDAMAEYAELYSTTAETSVRIAYLRSRAAALEEKRMLASLWDVIQGVGCPCVTRHGSMAAVVPADEETPHPTPLELEAQGTCEKQPACGASSRTGKEKVAKQATCKGKGSNAPNSFVVEHHEIGDSISIGKLTHFRGFFACLVWFIS
mmetsp:Transcript_35047/g.109080  ORF Transcript_35047/g.109080 Transcript_35047/m.109080 type:complete len:284 (-) Transcript_35047:278-1129(-)